MNTSRLVWTVFVFALLLGSTGDRPYGFEASRPRTLTFEERVAAQRAIEEVYWRHRIWPKANSVAKPSLDAVMPESIIRAKVEVYLTKSNALETWWQRPILPGQLQAEMDRMARQTRDPDMLRELFAALANDPFLIAETLGRQTLADRLIRSWYTRDDRFHGELRRKAEAALAQCSDVACLQALEAEVREATVELRGEGTDDARSVPSDARVDVDVEEWESYIDRLAAKLGGSPELLPIERPSALEETAEEFTVTAVLSQEQRKITTAVVAWPKRPFDSWWTAQSEAVDLSIEPSPSTFALPRILRAACRYDTWTPTPIDVPDPRYNHTAVWTGTEMIIWGGGTVFGFGPLDTGGRYDPATDTWTPTSRDANRPSARGRHAAVWTGTEMIVWGGISGSYLNNGGRYDPARDTWMPIPADPSAPSPGQFPTAVWTGTEMIVWSGCCPLSNTGGRYDPVTDSWTPISAGPNVPTPRGGFSTVWTGTEMIVWGGGDSNTGGRYDPVTDSWAPTSTGPNVPAPRNHHTAVWTGTEMIVWGGGSNTGGRYDPLTDSWMPTSTGTNVPSSRSHHLAVWTGREMIVWGGSSNTGGRYNPLTDSWMPTSTGANVPLPGDYTAVWTGMEMIVWGVNAQTGSTDGGRHDPATDSWVPISMGGSVPAGRNHHTAVWTGAEMIVWGGRVGDSGGSPVNTGGRYNPATETWRPTSTRGAVPSPRYAHAAVWTGSEMIVWGGGPGPTNTGGRFDPATDRWTATSTGDGVPEARFPSGAAVWTGKEMIVWGGSTLVNNGGRYDPVTDSWTPTSTGANVPSARSGHTLVWTGKEMIVWGGQGENTGGRYDPATDTWLATSTGPNVPQGRFLHTAVWTGSEMIVWGGDVLGSPIITNTGGRYDPVTDTWRTTSTRARTPTARRVHTAVWTGREMVVWGGNANPGQPRTGGRYDPWTDTWAPTSVGANAPAGREFFTSVWTGSEMIVWGGRPYSLTGGRYCACPKGGFAWPGRERRWPLRSPATRSGEPEADQTISNADSAASRWTREIRE